MTERLEDPSADAAEPEFPAEPGTPFARHVELRTVVLPDLKIVFLPIPKGGCTSILWLLSGLAEIPPETFLHSTLPEVSPSLTVHDMSLWNDEQRLHVLAMLLEALGLRRALTLCPPEAVRAALQTAKPQSET